MPIRTPAEFLGLTETEFAQLPEVARRFVALHAEHGEALDLDRLVMAGFTPADVDAALVAMQRHLHALCGARPLGSV